MPRACSISRSGRCAPQPWMPFPADPECRDRGREPSRHEAVDPRPTGLDWSALEMAPLSITRTLPPMMSRLTMRHLRIVLAIAEYGNLVAAARQLNMTQSAITKALQEAEAHLGIELFMRTNRGAVPTAYGEALATHAQL